MIDVGPYYDAAQDPRMFAARFCHTVHQTPHGARVEPFPDYDYFRPLWLAIANHEDIFVEKTRQMGISWALAIAFLWRMLFRRDWTCLMVSRKEKLVDDGGSRSTFQSLLGKVRFVHDHLPTELRAPVDFSFLKAHNPETGSSIVGESSSPDAGRSGNFRNVLLDEAAYIPHGESVYSAVRSACPQGLILASTPNGKSNVFWRIRNADNAGYTIIRMHWSQHPERRCDCPPGEHRGCWYASHLEDMTTLQVARECDISYEDSVAGRVWYGWGAHNVTRVPYLPGLPVYRAWDFGVGDQTAIIYAQVPTLHTASGKVKKQIRVFDAYRNSGQGALHYREVCQEKAAKYEGSPVVDVGDPHNLTSRDSGLTSWAINLADKAYPYRIHVRPSRCRGIPYEKVIDNARKFMGLIECQDSTHQPRLLVDEGLRALIGCFEGWNYKTDDEDHIVAEKPQHDDMSHWMDAFKYLCWDVDPMSGLTSEFDPKDAAIVVKPEIFTGKEVW